MTAATSNSEFALTARGLVKRYEDLVAVDGIDLEVRAGTCLGVLGPNGAGKTTTIEMLEGLKPPDQGEIEILGLGWDRDGARIRAAIGVQLQETEFQDKLTAFETLRMFRSFYGGDTRTPEEVLELVGLLEKRDAHVVKLSGGQKQRLAVGCALLNRPRILFLDEPTTGLDPQARRRVWEVIEEFKHAGGTCLLTTHYMEEAERLADDLVIVDRGKVITRGSPTAVIDALEAESVVEFVPLGQAPPSSELEELDGVQAVRLDGDTVTLSVTDAQLSIAALFALFERRGIALENLRTHRPTLEDVFVSLTGKHLRDE